MLTRTRPQIPGRAAWVIVATLLCQAFLFSTASASQPLVLGIHPYLQHSEIARRFSPLAEYLSQGLGESVEVRVGKSYQAHVEAVAENTTDIAYMGPASYLKLTTRFRAKPLLARLEADHSPTFKGHIVVTQQSPLKSLADLRGRKFAFGDPDSTASSAVPRALLQKAGISLTDLESFKHYKNHTNVALAVLSGDADAGGVKEEVYRQFRDRGLRSLSASPPIPEHVFVASDALPVSKIEKIRALLLAIDSPDLVAKLLKPIKKSATGLVPAKEEDYLALQQLIGDNPVR